MNGLWLILAAAGLLLVSGVPAYLARPSDAAQRMACAVVVLGSLVGWCGLAVAWHSPEPSSLSFAWHVPLGSFSIGLDALGAVFLVPVFVVPALGSVYGLRYWRQSEHPDNGRRLGLFFGVLSAAMVMVVVARDWILLLIVWEIMATAAYFLTVLEHEKRDYCRAGWIYLVATHVGAVFLMALIALLRQLTGNFAFEAALPTSGVAATLFVLALLGFGFKAEALPLIWLPNAHANAPSHVAAIMSGVLLNMGIYGLLRVLTLLPSIEPWNGGVLLGIGAATGIFGIAFAIGQSDINRLLAYSSIENVGIIFMGIGLALLGRALHRADLIVLGLGGALLHVWNHSLFKPLLFLCAGAVVRATRTRDIDQLGGLAKRMPQTAWLFLLGAAAICGLPPLNGFASKWPIYLGFFSTLTPADGAACPAAATGAVALALIGALSLACFVKVYGAVFLGQSRPATEGALEDPPRSMRGPMLLLAAGCVVFGVFPRPALALVRQVVSQWTEPLGAGSVAMDSFAPIPPVGGMAAVLVLLLIGVVAGVRGRPAAVGITWSFGYAAPRPRMQYTATSFAQLLVNLFAWVLHPRRKPPVLRAMFPRQTAFASEVPDTVLDRILLPLFLYAGRQMMKLRLLQQGRIHIYLLYIFFAMLFLLCWEKFGIGN